MSATFFESLEMLSAMTDYHPTRFIDMIFTPGDLTTERRGELISITFHHCKGLPQVKLPDMIKVFGHLTQKERLIVEKHFA